MPPKVAQKTKEQKLKAALSGGKGRKKKWSKGKVKEKLQNAILFDKNIYDKMMKELPKTKLIPTAIVSERIKVNGSLARQAIRHLAKENLIEPVGEQHHATPIYTRIVDATQE